MSHKHVDTAEAVAKWLETSGYSGDLSALTAGLHDFVESIDEINNKLIPALLRLKPTQRDEALSVIVDLIIEFEHIGRHCSDAADCLSRVRDFLDESPGP